MTAIADSSNIESKAKNRSKKTLIKVLAAIAVLLVIISIAAPYIVPNDPYKQNAAAIRKPPSKEFPLGTDNLGRCVLSRVLMGARTSICAGLILVVISFVLGTSVGIIAGYFEGPFETISMRLIDILLSFPQMVLAIAVAGILGGGMINAMIALGFTGWILYARLARTQTIALKQEDFIAAARIGGKSSFKIMTKHIFPNIAGTLLVNATLQISSMLIGFAGLSFLGLGVQVPEAEWGSMINESMTYFQLAPWAVLVPCAAVVITAMFFNYLGDTAKDLIDRGYKK